MTEKTLGQSGLSIEPFVLGGNVFGMTAGRDASFAILDRFAERGGGMIDTADVYSAWVPGHKGGESESMIGAWLKARGARDKILIATKVGMMPGGLKPDRIRDAAQGSLDRLATDTIDLYFAHKDDPDVPLDEVLGAFAELVDAGMVRAIGASNYSADRLAEALRVSDANGLPRYTVVQPELNLLDRGQYEGALQKLCIAEGLGVVTYFSLASGYLSGKYRTSDDLGKSPRGARVGRYLEGKGPMVLTAMEAIAAETGATLSQIALAWVAAQPGVTAPIASATTVEQLDDIMGSLDLALTVTQRAALTAAGA
ncbi:MULTISPECIES: aldo/keto reductase [unclassified Sphingopyxis]|uniref:aldo/keto reductase n=1 Tax=unclassified Sphingopyxis TaxID=2614943 RepID=UPI0007301FB3|nr:MULTISPECIES: aldo/keto reductase [unclassified Sphingopyxis]KTE28197.1 alcohol dehydrogenase [Sphingopyxis sp. H057]KTE55421.1 alcohol dehydrogenase [Sphingopyxis sp. H073]KTE57689.1 alcohol dehydrogenase [Sphingopyxis sp. H071]KTE61075.1 alcohol dehydrogenase [Sphingopyxis sp. H107]KTE66308.1 alcohol dehydrogenase [Sphingopyxis sp. H100]